MKSSIKKFAAYLLAAVMVLSVAPVAFAETQCSLVGDYSVNEDIIELTVGVTDNVDRAHVLVYVSPNKDEASHSNALAMGYAVAPVNGSVKVELSIPDSVPTGKYRISFGVSGMKNKRSARTIDNVNYIGKADRDALTDVLVNAEQSDELLHLFDVLPVFFDIYGSNSTYYKALNEKDRKFFAQYIIDRRSSFVSGDTADFAKAAALANEAFVVTYIRSEYTTSKDDTKRAALGYTGVFNEYSGIINEAVNSGLAKPVLTIENDSRYKSIENHVVFFHVLRTQCEAAADGAVTDIANLTLEALDNTLTLERINECGSRKIGEIIKEYNSVLGIDEAQIQYVTKNSTIKDFFGKAMTDSTKAYALPVYSIEALRETWDKAYAVAEKTYEAYLKEDNSPSGGSGSKQTVAKNPVTIDTSIVRDDPLNKKKSITDYYNDMAGYEWAAGAVLALTEEGIVSGTGDMKYEPARTLKREEFMKLLVNTFKLADMKAVCSFTDVTDTNAWYYVYIASAEKAGITTGRGDGTFGVGEYVTREEMATLVYRAAVKAGAKLAPSTTRGTTLYSDVASLSDYAREAVLTLTDCGIMNGSDGKFLPKDGASRAQAAIVINNIKSYIK